MQSVLQQQLAQMVVGLEARQKKEKKKRKKKKNKKK